MAYLTVIDGAGHLKLAPYEYEGFGPGQAVNVYRLSTGNLLIVPDDSTPIDLSLASLPRGSTKPLCGPDMTEASD